MKTLKPWMVTCLAIATLSLWSGGVRADAPGSHWLAQPALIQKLDAQGFKHVTALKAVHGHWEGEAFQHGEIVVFHANPQTGQVTFEKAKDNAKDGH